MWLYLGDSRAGAAKSGGRRAVPHAARERACRPAPARSGRRRTANPIYLSIDIYIYKLKHIYLYLSIYLSIDLYVYTLTHTYIYIYIYTYTCGYTSEILVLVLRKAEGGELCPTPRVSERVRQHQRDGGADARNPKYIYLYLYPHIIKHIYLHRYLSIYMYVCIHTHAHTHTHIYIYICIYMYIYIYIYICIYI